MKAITAILCVSQCALAIAAVLFSGSASAITYRVGVGSGCTHSNVQAAVTAAENSPGADEIQIARNQAYNAQQIDINTQQDLLITGGFATCQANADGSPTTLDGSGGLPAPVLTIRTSSAIIRLRKLSVVDGDTGGSARGGGIYFVGNGILDIADMSISNNSAGFGGGIAVVGTGEQTELVVGDNVTISSNTARFNGGGLHLQDVEASIYGLNTTILLNRATGTGSPISGGFGGGVVVRACALDSIAYVGSPGVGNLGVIHGNTARYGGGVTIDGARDCNRSSPAIAKLELFSTNAANLTKISDNAASIGGGAIYAIPDEDNGQFADAVAAIYNAAIENNEAPQGSAIFLETDGDRQAGADFNIFSGPFAAAVCARGMACGRIRGNVGIGSVVYGRVGNNLRLNKVAVSGNSGSELFNLSDQYIINSLITQNTTTARLVQSARIELVGTTIAGNTIGAAAVLGINGLSEIKDSIIWQPGKQMINNAGSGQVIFLNGIINESLSFSGIADSLLTALFFDPRFVDPANGDFSLTAASPGVDSAGGPETQPRDLFTNSRSIQLSTVPDRGGASDRGALERQFLDPLVLNSDFDVDLRLWPANNNLSQATWDGTQNGSGPAGSGSMRFNSNSDPVRIEDDVDGGVVRPRSQCVRVPGPGIYRISAWGRSLGVNASTRDKVKLNWALRRANAITIPETCPTATPADASGQIFVTSSATWTQSPTPAVVQISAAEWTRSSTIVLTPEAEEGDNGPSLSSINAWIDGIKIQLIDSDILFKDGFE